MGRRWVRNWLSLLVVVYLGLTALIGTLALGAPAGALTLLLYLPTGLFFLWGAALVAAGVTLRRHLLAAMGLVGLALSAAVSGFQWKAATAATGQRLVVATCNVQSWDTDHHRVGRFLAGLEADVLFLQEAWWNEHLLVMEEHLDGYHRVLGGSSGDLAVLARVPLRPVLFHVPTFQGLIVRGSTAFGPLYLVNLHYRKGEKRMGLPSPRDTLRVQDEDSRATLEALAQLDGPVLLAGDLNAPPTSPFVRRLESVLQDCFTEGGSGFGYTFPSFLPLWRIDYLWHSGPFRVEKAVTLRGVSDHRALRVVLVR